MGTNGARLREAEAEAGGRGWAVDFGRLTSFCVS